MASDQVQSRGQARIFGQIALRDIAVDHHGAVLAYPREEGFDLGRGGVLRLIEQDEGVFPAAAAHHLERHHLDIAPLECDFERGTTDSLLNRVDDRGRPGREFLLERSRKEAERTAAGHVGAGENDAVDAPLAEQIGSMGGGDQSIPAYVSALLEQTAESLDSLQRTISRGEENRSTGNAAMMALADRLATLTDSMRVQQDLMAKLAESQMEMRPVLRRMSESIDQDRTLSLDEASRAHLRNLDVYVMRLLEESASGRTQMMEDVRSEIKLLARTMAGISASRRDRD